MKTAGWALIAAAVGVTGAGIWLGRRYGAATRNTQLVRTHPWSHSALAFLGDALVLVGVIVLMIAIMVTFF